MESLDYFYTRYSMFDIMPLIVKLIFIVAFAVIIVGVIQNIS